MQYIHIHRVVSICLGLGQSGRALLPGWMTAFGNWRTWVSYLNGWFWSAS